jgi:hypothetical protein
MQLTNGATTDNEIQVKLSCQKSLQVIVQTNRNQLQLVYASNHTFISPGTLMFNTVHKHISSHIYRQVRSNIQTETSTLFLSGYWKSSQIFYNVLNISNKICHKISK